MFIGFPGSCLPEHLLQAAFVEDIAKTASCIVFVQRRLLFEMLWASMVMVVVVAVLVVVVVAVVVMVVVVAFAFELPGIASVVFVVVVVLVVVVVAVDVVIVVVVVVAETSMQCSWYQSVTRA